MTKTLRLKTNKTLRNATAQVQKSRARIVASIIALSKNPYDLALRMRLLKCIDHHVDVHVEMAERQRV